ncbi:AAA family ATPase [Pseudomonas putida]|uniref:AAA family ATPase n=1 Tax=Pseudomonas putida TaxID=303 RepID=UPI0009020387|nr:AAA family ATPase [Pseudomonas putida]
MGTSLIPEDWTFSGGIKTARSNPEWIITGLIESGDQWIVSGQPKVGKSIFAMSMAAAVATGESFIGYNCSVAKRVLYFDLELKDRIFWSRLDLMFSEAPSEKLNNLIRPNNLSSLDVFNETDQSFIAKTIALTEPDLIIWDVLSRLHCRDENDNSSMKLVLQKIRSLSNSRAHIIVHHSRKNVGYGNADAQSIRGAGAIHGEVDGAITLTHNSSLGICNMNISARALPPQEDLLIEIDSTLNFKKHLKAKDEEIRATMRGCLSTDEKHTSKSLNEKLQKTLGIEARQASRIISQAKKSGIITGKKIGRSVFYSLAQTDDI